MDADRKQMSGDADISAGPQEKNYLQNWKQGKYYMILHPRKTSNGYTCN
jgi:hypothetical protein